MAEVTTDVKRYMLLDGEPMCHPDVGNR